MLPTLHQRPGIGIATAQELTTTSLRTSHSTPPPTVITVLLECSTAVSQLLKYLLKYLCFHALLTQHHLRAVLARMSPMPLPRPGTMTATAQEMTQMSLRTSPLQIPHYALTTAIHSNVA